jgi:hypothetical protein
MIHDHRHTRLDERRQEAAETPRLGLDFDLPAEFLRPCQMGLPGRGAEGGVGPADQV